MQEVKPHCFAEHLDNKCFCPRSSNASLCFFRETNCSHTITKILCFLIRFKVSVHMVRKGESLGVSFRDIPISFSQKENFLAKLVLPGSIFVSIRAPLCESLTFLLLLVSSCSSSIERERERSVMESVQSLLVLTSLIWTN